MPTLTRAAWARSRPQNKAGRPACKNASVPLVGQQQALDPPGRPPPPWRHRPWCSGNLMYEKGADSQLAAGHPLRQLGLVLGEPLPVIGAAFVAQAVHAYTAALGGVFHQHALLLWAVCETGRYAPPIRRAAVGLHAQHRQQLLLRAT